MSSFISRKSIFVAWPGWAFAALVMSSLFVLGLSRGWIQSGTVSPEEPLFEPKLDRIETAPLCPWRQPEKDMKEFFPEATHYEKETRILSGLRVELAEKLGRTVKAEENALLLYQIYHLQDFKGTLVTRRVKGEYGAIEIALAVQSDGAIAGLRLQRLREPENIARVLQDPGWLSAFQGKKMESSWKLGDGLPQVTDSARISAEAVAEGVRSLLVLLQGAIQHNALRVEGHH